MAVHKRHSPMFHNCFDFLTLPRTLKPSFTQSRDTPASTSVHTNGLARRGIKSDPQVNRDNSPPHHPHHDPEWTAVETGLYLSEAEPMVLENNNNVKTAGQPILQSSTVEDSSHRKPCTTGLIESSRLKTLEHTVSVLACEIEPETLRNYHERRCRIERRVKSCRTTTAKSPALSYDDFQGLLMTTLQERTDGDFRVLSSTLHSAPPHCSKYIISFFNTLQTLLKLVSTTEVSSRPVADPLRDEQNVNNATHLTTHPCDCCRDTGSMDASVVGSLNIDVQYIDRYTRALQDFNNTIEIKKQKQQQRLFRMYLQDYNGNEISHDICREFNLNENGVTDEERETKQKLNSEVYRSRSVNHSTPPRQEQHQTSPTSKCSDMNLDLHTCSSSPGANLDLHTCSSSPGSANTNHVKHGSSNSTNSNQLYDKQDKEDLYIPVLSVELHQMCLCDGRMRRLEQSLESNSSVRSLLLTGARLDGPALLRVSRVIEVTEGLYEVALRGCEIGDDGAMFLASALRVNKTIHRLDVRGNSITAMGTRYISRALMRNRTLTDLDLGLNAVGSSGCRALLDPLSIPGCSLRRLHLADNHIMDDGLTVLFRALRRNFKLSFLDISGNSVGDKTLAAVTAVLQVNRTLRELRAERCIVGLDECVSKHSHIKILH